MLCASLDNRSADDDVVDVCRGDGVHEVVAIGASVLWFVQVTKDFFAAFVYALKEHTHVPTLITHGFHLAPRNVSHFAPGRVTVNFSDMHQGSNGSRRHSHESIRRRLKIHLVAHLFVDPYFDLVLELIGRLVAVVGGVDDDDNLLR